MKKQLFLTLALLVGASSTNVHAAEGGWGEIGTVAIKLLGFCGMFGLTYRIGNYDEPTNNTIQSTLEKGSLLAGSGLVVASFTKNQEDNSKRVGLASTVFGVSYITANNKYTVDFLRNIPVAQQLLTSPVDKDGNEQLGFGSLTRNLITFMAYRSLLIAVCPNTRQYLSGFEQEKLRDNNYN